MPKSRKRKRKAKPVKRPAPFGVIERATTASAADMREAAANLGRQGAVVFPEQVALLEGQLANVYPLNLLAVVAAYGLAATVGGGEVKAALSDRGFNQHHVEILQALALRREEKDWGGKVLTPDDVDPAFEALVKASDAYFFRRFPQDVNLTDEQLLLRSIQEKLRVNTQVVRNWGHFSQVVRHSRELYSALDGMWAKHIGLPFGSIVDIITHILKQLDQRADNRLQMLLKMKRATTTKRMFELYYELRPDMDGKADDLNDVMRHLTPQQAFGTILAHTDLLLPDHYTTNIPQLAEELKLDVGSVQKFFDAFSLKPGDLAASNVEHLWLDNPVWTKPFMRLSADVVFSAVPHAFFSHIHKLVYTFAASVGAEEEYSDARSKFLETKLNSVVEAGLHTAKLTPGETWKLKGEQYETDLLAVIDQAVVIFEAKSGRLSDEGLRGAPDRAKRHVQDLLIDPSVQSARLKKVIEGVDVDEGERAAILKVFNLKADVPYRVSRIGITLDDFSPLAASERELKQIGWVEADHDLAPSLTISSLEVVFDILENPAITLHYLSARSQIQKHFDVVGDELDLLALYMESAFNVFNLSRNNVTSLVIGGASAPIDNYYNCLDANEPATKPTMRLPSLWRSILRQLQTRYLTGWTEVAHALMSCASPPEMRRFAKEYEKMAARIPRAGKNPGHKYTGTITPPQERSTAICLFAYRTAERQMRGEAAMRMSTAVFDKPHIDKCWLLGFDVDRDHRLDRMGTATRQTTELREEHVTG